MDRRDFLKASVAATVGAAIETTAQTKGKSGKKPNILYLFSDQHRAVSLPGEPYSPVVAPTLDSFRKSNLSMDMCISNYPLCMPYRSILMSGKYPQETGVMKNGPGLGTSHFCLGQAFLNAGYHTGYVGKWHVGTGGKGEGGFIPPGAGRIGFEDWHIWDNTNDHYHSWTYDPVSGEKITPEGYQPTRMTDQALTFLQGQKDAQKPWFLIVSWNPPHPPFDPPAEDKNLYQPDSIKARPNVHLAPEGHPTKTRKPLASVNDFHLASQGYYGGITAIDREFARILAALKELNLENDTIVIYTSDHGEMLGSHGHIAKQMPHEESSRVPFFIRVPGAQTKAKKSKVLFSSIDIYPSLCGLAGIPVPKSCRGRDLSSALRGESNASPEHVFLLNELKPHSPEQFTPTYRGIRTARYTYAIADTGRWCLYDNEADPYQQKNLVKDPAHKDLIADFEIKIAAWMKSVGDKFPLAEAQKAYCDHPDYPLPDPAPGNA